MNNFQSRFKQRKPNCIV